jgi:hypothetical protein
MGDFLERLGRGIAVRVRQVAAWLGPRCFVLVIFSDGSFLVAKFSRLEPAREELAIEGDGGFCQLRADLGGVRIYRYERQKDVLASEQYASSRTVQ